MPSPTGFDPAEIDGHMRMRAAPAAAAHQAHHQKGRGSFSFGLSSPCALLHEQAMARDCGAGPSPIPPSPSEGWNADDLIIPGASADLFVAGIDWHQPE